MENIKLDNGKFLNRHYGKYNPNLTIISNEELDNDVLKEKSLDTNIIHPNLKFDGHIISVYRGWYRKNAKGTDIFEHHENGKHLFITIDWGGCFDSTRGDCTTPNTNFLYQRRASSNGGGTGVSFYIFDNDTVIQNLSEDDF